MNITCRLDCPIPAKYLRETSELKDIFFDGGIFVRQLDCDL